MGLGLQEDAEAEYYMLDSFIYARWLALYIDLHSATYGIPMVIYAITTMSRELRYIHHLTAREYYVLVVILLFFYVKSENILLTKKSMYSLF